MRILHPGCAGALFFYGVLFMANGASLLLPGSNLTNLIVMAHKPLSVAAFAQAMVLPWLAVVAITIAFVAVVYRPKTLRGEAESVAPFGLGLGVAVTVAATVLILVLSNAALPVLVVGVAAVMLRRLRPRLSLHVLSGLFLLAVALGTLARRWGGPALLLDHLGGVGSAALGAISSVAINNLPAATLLSARPPAHPLPLLIGLNLGPNLAATGSLSAYLWYQAARRVDARPSFRQLSILGAALVPLTTAAALAALAVGDPGAF